MPVEKLFTFSLHLCHDFTFGGLLYLKTFSAHSEASLLSPGIISTSFISRNTMSSQLGLLVKQSLEYISNLSSFFSLLCLQPSQTCSHVFSHSAVSSGFFLLSLSIKNAFNFPQFGEWSRKSEGISLFSHPILNHRTKVQTPLEHSCFYF